ncbi:unnamed protein product [Orchesella dallaii]|uniref:Serpin domain-containing protein n=1 Tax=Orchesella dallaii TaxID=48710 RepID=A0ABP1QTL9_9HEXA
MAESAILSTANNEFTKDLYQALFPGNSSGNLIFSPFSLNAVLGMVGLGAKGDTRDEIFRGLRFTENSEEVIAKSYHSVISGFQKAMSPETFTLLTANRVYSQVGFGLNQTFVNQLKDHFLADFEQLDFSTSENCKAAADKINNWVESTTNNKIKDLISQDALGPLTRLVLVNGIYFKGLWEHQFKPDNTSKSQFRTSESNQVDVDMMYIQEKFPYAELPELDAEAVSLPYKGGRLSMVIILPKAVDGLTKLQTSIGSILQGGKSLVSERLTKTDKVELSLPKFKIEATIGNLSEVLQALGIKSMFSQSGADFSGIPEGANPGLFVSSVIQKAFIEVNEEGAEAAAATGLVMMMRCLPITIPFIVDRPFYFQIVDHANGELVLFSGHCNDPTK